MTPQHRTAHPSTDEALKLLAARVEVDSEVLESLVNSLGEYYSKLLTVREVEELLSVSRQTIYRLIESGELTRVNVGTAARIPLRSVADYVNHKITEVTQEPVAAS